MNKEYIKLSNHFLKVYLISMYIDDPLYLFCPQGIWLKWFCIICHKQSVLCQIKFCGLYLISQIPDSQKISGLNWYLGYPLGNGTLETGHLLGFGLLIFWETSSGNREFGNQFSTVLCRLTVIVPGLTSTV